MAEDWELAKLIHELDGRNNARHRARVSQLGLTVAQASALRELTGPMTMRELAARMGCEPSNATVVIDNLEKQELIERLPHPTDRRAKQLMLTPQGTDRRTALLTGLRQEEPLMAALTQKDREALTNLLQAALSFDEAFQHEDHSPARQRSAHRDAVQQL